MEELKNKDPQFRGMVLPHCIDLDTLFSLEVDDELMQDVGLDFGDNRELPDWLADDSVRSGIKAMQLHDRALEERTRLADEAVAMVNWLEEELASISNCIGKCRGDRVCSLQLMFGWFGLSFIIAYRLFFIIPTSSTPEVCTSARSEMACKLAGVGCWNGLV